MHLMVSLLVAILLVAACQAGPVAPTVNPSPSAAAPSQVPDPSVVAPSPDDPPAFDPLPPDLALVPGPQDPSARLTATSLPGATPGVVQAFALGHCGLGSPFDFDGSLWDPIAGRDAQGGPIDTEEEIGELINATEGEVLLMPSGQAQFRTPLGSIILLTRHVGAKSYFLCA